MFTDSRFLDCVFEWLNFPYLESFLVVVLGCIAVLTLFWFFLGGSD